MRTPPETPPRGRPFLRVVEDLGGLRTEDASGVGIGATVGSLAERATGLVRYLDVAVEALRTHVLVPVGHARFLREERDEPEVRLRAALLEDLARIPAFDPATTDLDDPYEQALLHAHGVLFHGERYYAHPAYDHAGLFAAESPLVPPALAAGGSDATDGLPPPADTPAPLVPLGSLEGWRVAGGEADPRGWTLAVGGAPVGTVRALLVEPGARRVRYLGADADGRSVLLPVGFLRLDRDARTVAAPGLTAPDLAALPVWDGGPVDRAGEARVRSVLDERLVEERRYARPDFAFPGAQ